ncbi:phytanoyl-CoA dioxygenase [Sandaracinomonas limnophila]|uniref:Phytanoyl-CoA dioxygenase n=1 Tax=Sandaracinomonas limnophila TaxID=1862386 RepID=A0A437PNZ2_9BACT|nr:phytanoyl-CoA dioxygenase family protein [Sandaracinomonas limnophila]RVU24023.1 phytanoyl-CoA dioxygenase [Sandaracinomonas limnophila]
METNLPWVESPFFEKILAKKNLSKENEELAKSYNKDGYIVLKNIFSEQEIDLVIKDMKEIGFNPDFKTDNFRNDVRIQDLWMYSEPVKNLSINPKILSVLEMLYDREVVPFQTLNFKVGSQQIAHSDTMHFSSLPARFMCGVWIALEDITEENGPLFYYPGSHKTPEYTFAQIYNDVKDSSYDDYPKYEEFMSELMEVSPFEKKKFFAKKGDALVWSSNIIHGGSPVLKEGSTRYSQVTHYYFKDCIYYTPMLSNMVTGEYFLRRHIVNMRNGEIEDQNYNGEKVNFNRTYKQLYTLNQHIKIGKYMRFLAEKFLKFTK